MALREPLPFGHRAFYTLGERALEVDERVVVFTCEPRTEVIRVADHFRLHLDSPRRLFDYHAFPDGEGIPRFQTKRALEDAITYARFVESYGSVEKPIYGQGLKGKVVYVVQRLDSDLTPQDLSWRLRQVVQTAKYQGAEAVVVLAYTLNYSAQERGTLDKDHHRMKNDKAMRSFDGQMPSAFQMLETLLTAGADAVITPHSHCPDDLSRIANELNELYYPLHQRAVAQGSNMRYKIDFHHVDLSPMIGYMVSDFGEEHLGFDLSEEGRRILFVGADDGAAEFARNCRIHSGLKRSALGIMTKRKAPDGSIEILALDQVEGLDESRNIEGMDILCVDDLIRTAATMRNNMKAVRGENVGNLERALTFCGQPRKIAVYATRSDLSSEARGVLRDPAIDTVVLTNADHRALQNLAGIGDKTLLAYINFVMAFSARAVEKGENPNNVLTPETIRNGRLLQMLRPHGYRKEVDLRRPI